MGNRPSDNNNNDDVELQNSSNGKAEKSPFFAPSTPRKLVVVEQSTPGGTKHKRIVKQRKSGESEHKSTVLGCTANLVNAIVGSGIVGIPFALQQAGFGMGLTLILLVGVLTVKSLRLLVDTARAINVPSYEMLLEAAFGSFGFLFISVSMFVIAFGAMVSYLMMVKDTLALLIVSQMQSQDDDDEDLAPLKRSLLFIISITTMFPLSCQRDMADLAATSRINVLIDCVLVVMVTVNSIPHIQRHFFDDTDDDIASDIGFSWTVRWETLFVGLGVLSFAFVCQHSAFIIAGSLNNPTHSRWGRAARFAILISGSLMILNGTSGYLAFGSTTQGNILNNLRDDTISANVARGLLGITMLFVYPMESFVARHVCVVLLFQGRRAHEGEDSVVLTRRDRRITLTLVLYVLALAPAMLFDDMGQVLAISGAIGGSCLSYIGPGVVYLGIYGKEFLEWIERQAWNQRRRPLPPLLPPSPQQQPTPNTAAALLSTGGTAATASTTASSYTQATPMTPDPADQQMGRSVSFCTKCVHVLWWHFTWMPLWCAIAQLGKQTLEEFQQEQALKSPHPLRIEPNRRQQQHLSRAQQRAAENEAASSHHSSQRAAARRADSWHESPAKSYGASTSNTAPPPRRLVRPPSSSSSFLLAPKDSITSSHHSFGGGEKCETSNTEKQALLARTSPQPQKTTGNDNGGKEEEEEEEEEGEKTPTPLDFLVAIGYILFGLLALLAGIISIVVSNAATAAAR